MRLINRHPDAVSRLMLPTVPFVLAAVWYLIASSARLSVNPDDKLLPALSTMGDAIWRVAFLPDRRTGQLVLWSDTAASLQRLGAGLAISAAGSFLLAVVIGMLPLARSLLARIVEVISLIPPLAVLPILLIVVGLGEVSKVVLIVIGTAPFLVRRYFAMDIILPYVTWITLIAFGIDLSLRLLRRQLFPWAGRGG